LLTDYPRKLITEFATIKTLKVAAARFGSAIPVSMSKGKIMLPSFSRLILSEMIINDTDQDDAVVIKKT